MAALAAAEGAQKEASGGGPESPCYWEFQTFRRAKKCQKGTSDADSARDANQLSHHL